MQDGLGQGCVVCTVLGEDVRLYAHLGVAAIFAEGAHVLRRAALAVVGVFGFLARFRLDLVSTRLDLAQLGVDAISALCGRIKERFRGKIRVGIVTVMTGINGIFVELKTPGPCDNKNNCLAAAIVYAGLRLRARPFGRLTYDKNIPNYIVQKFLIKSPQLLIYRAYAGALAATPGVSDYITNGNTIITGVHPVVTEKYYQKYKFQALFGGTKGDARADSNLLSDDT